MHLDFLTSAMQDLSLHDPPPPPPARSLRKRQRIRYSQFQGEHEIPIIMGLVDSELSEPYNFYTYRYFLNDW